MSDNRSCFYHEKRKLVRIDLENVLYLESSGNYTRFVEQNQTHIVRVSLEKALELVPEDAFLRIAKSHALSTSKVKEFNKTSAWFNKRGGDPDLEYRPSKKYYEEALLKLNILDRDFGEWVEIPMEE